MVGNKNSIQSVLFYLTPAVNVLCFSTKYTKNFKDLRCSLDIIFDIEVDLTVGVLGELLLICFHHGMSAVFVFSNPV